MEDIYKNGDYIKSNPTWHEEDSPWKANHIYNMIRKNNLSPRSICEIGCGAGEILNQLSLKVSDDVNLYGYEISPQAFDICAKKNKENLIFRFSDLLQDKKTHFDIILVIDVIEHIDDYLNFLRQLKEKSDSIVLHIPLDISVQTIVRSSILSNKRKSIGHIHYFTKESALDSLVDSGYEVVDYFYTASSIELSEKSLKARFLNVFRRALYCVNKDFTVKLLGGYSLMVLVK